MCGKILALIILGGFACYADIPQSGADIVKGNAAKEFGYSEAQLKQISKALKGKELSFANGRIQSVDKDEDDGNVTMLVDFDAPNGGLFSPTFTLHAKVTGSKAKIAENLDEGTKLSELKGTVKYDPDFFMFFELQDASFTVAPGTNASRTDYSGMTGADIVKGNAAKESGYSEAQLKQMSKALKGKELSFENGKIQSVDKDEDDGSVTMLVAFDAPRGGLFSPTFMLHAKVMGAQAKEAENLDEGTKLSELRGTVKYDPDFFMFFELVDAKIKLSK